MLLGAFAQAIPRNPVVSRQRNVQFKVAYQECTKSRTVFSVEVGIVLQTYDNDLGSISCISRR